MQFSNDIFISYAHIDNQPLIQDTEGWVSQFHHALEVRVDQLLGELGNLPQLDLAMLAVVGRELRNLVTG